MQEDYPSNGTEELKWKKIKEQKYVSTGLNPAWHKHGFEILKHYGFLIHGFAERFSWTIMWLKVTRSNSNPVVISASYYFETVSALHCIKYVRIWIFTDQYFLVCAWFSLASTKWIKQSKAWLNTHLFENQRIVPCLVTW